MEEENIYVGVGWFRSWFFWSSLVHLWFAGFSEGEITHHPECKSRWKKCMCEQIALAFKGEKATDLTAAKVFLCCSIKGCFTQASVKKEFQPSSNFYNSTKISAPLGLWTLMVTFLFHSAFQWSTLERKSDTPDTIQLYLPLPPKSLINAQEFGHERGPLSCQNNRNVDRLSINSTTTDAMKIS